MDYVKRNSDGTEARVFTEKTQSSVNAAATVIRVGTVAELEAAVAAQIAGQTIEVVAGDYTLTESLTILLAANGGGLKAIGTVNIVGDAAADEAILIDPAVGTATFEYTLDGFASIKGGSGKIGLQVLNTAIAKKVIVYLKQTSLNDNAAGKALTVINTDGSNAIRIYADGPAEIDGMAITPKDGGDRLIMTGYNIEENLVAAVVNVAATFMFKQCKLPHEGMTGGHATNVISVANCWTEAVAFVPVLPDAGDFPGAFSATIYPAS